MTYHLLHLKKTPSALYVCFFLQGKGTVLDISHNGNQSLVKIKRYSQPRTYLKLTELEDPFGGVAWEIY